MYGKCSYAVFCVRKVQLCHIFLKVWNVINVITISYKFKCYNLVCSTLLHSTQTTVFTLRKYCTFISFIKERLNARLLYTGKFIVSGRVE